MGALSAKFWPPVLFTMFGREFVVTGEGVCGVIFLLFCSMVIALPCYIALAVIVAIFMLLLADCAKHC